MLALTLCPTKSKEHERKFQMELPKLHGSVVNSHGSSITRRERLGELCFISIQKPHLRPFRHYNWHKLFSNVSVNLIDEYNTIFSKANSYSNTFGISIIAWTFLGTSSSVDCPVLTQQPHPEYWVCVSVRTPVVPNMVPQIFTLKCWSPGWMSRWTERTVLKLLKTYHSKRLMTFSGVRLWQILSRATYYN